MCGWIKKYKIMNCDFCDIKSLEPRLIYKDDFVLAFPSNIPIVPGHIVVCPARHMSKIDEISDEELLAVKNFIVRLKNNLKNTLNAEGFNVAWNEGSMAGQSVSHLHIHVVPRKIGDSGIYEYEPTKFLYRPGSRAESPTVELAEIAELIKKGFELDK